MAQAVQSNIQAYSDSCCVAGVVYIQCISCGGHPRQVTTCQKCNGAGCTYKTCPKHAANASTGYSFSSYDGRTSNSTGNGTSTYGQNYGSSSSQ